VLLPTFAEVWADQFGLRESRDFRIVSSGQPRIELFETNQEIRFYSASKPERLVGDNISHASGTEIGLWRRLAWEKTNSRIRCPKGKRHQFLGEGTPEGMNWWQEEADFPDGVNEAKNARRITLWTDDNKYLPEGYIENQIVAKYGYDSAKLISYRYGRFVAFDKGTAYWNWVDRRNLVFRSDGIEPTPILRIQMHWDFNKSPLAWVATQHQPCHSPYGTFFKRYVGLGESSGRSRGIHDACIEFMVQFPPEFFRSTPIEVYGDPSGYAGSHLAPSCAYDQIYQYLREKYENVTICAAKAAPRIQARLERVNALLEHEQLVLRDDLANTRRSFSQTALKPGTWDIEKPKDDVISHWSDAIGYGLFQLTKDSDLENPERKQVYGTNAI